MKKIVILIICLAILGLGLYYFYLHAQKEKGEIDNFATWKKFIPQSGLFEVLLPDQPQYGKDFVNIPNSNEKRRYDMYASEKIDGTLFFVTVITYPPEVDTSSSNDILLQNIDELIQNKSDNHLTKFLHNIFEQHQALDFSFENHKFHVEGKALQDDHIVYVLVYITPKGDFDPEEYQHFVNSFKILKPAKEIQKQ